MDSETVMRTLVVNLRSEGEGELYSLIGRVLQATVRLVGVGVQHTLKLLQTNLDIQWFEEDGSIKSVDLYIPLHSEEDKQRALKLIGQDPTAKRLAKGKAAYEPKGVKQKAAPQYTNSYRMVAVIEKDGVPHVQCRIAETYSWVPEAGALKGSRQRDISMIDVKMGLQGLIKTWLKPPLADLPAALRAGICQQAGQQLNSYIGLLQYGKMPDVSFPSLLERDEDIRLYQWREAIDSLVENTMPLAYTRARELNPHKYETDDPRGDRLICADERWLKFVATPFPNPMTANFVKSDDVAVYKRQSTGRLYAALPLFEGVLEGSPLFRFSQEEKLRWWEAYVGEFIPLPAFSHKRLSVGSQVLLVPLEYKRPRPQQTKVRADKRGKQIVDFFSGHQGRKVNWSVLCQKPGNGEFPRFQIQFATSRLVPPKLRPNVLGIHFGLDPVLWWTVTNKQGVKLAAGKIEGNAILTEALAQSLHLREEQEQQRWIGEKRFSQELRRRTDDIARSIVELAAQWNANLALENIAWVKKQGGGSELNRRFSLWNYAQLLTRTTWMGMERTQGEEADAVMTVAEVSDYVLRYTCPNCGACRQAKQSPDKAHTWLEKSQLHCRKCGFVGEVPHEHQSQLVTQKGVEATNRLFEKQHKLETTAS